MKNKVNKGKNNCRKKSKKENMSEEMQGFRNKKRKKGKKAKISTQEKETRARAS